MTARAATTSDEPTINAWLSAAYDADPTWVCSPGVPYPDPSTVASYVTGPGTEVTMSLDATGNVQGVALWRTTDGLIAWLRVPQANVATAVPDLLNAVNATGVTAHGSVAIDATRTALLGVAQMVSDGGTEIHWT